MDKDLYKPFYQNPAPKKEKTMTISKRQI